MRRRINFLLCELPFGNSSLKHSCICFKDFVVKYSGTMKILSFIGETIFTTATSNYRPHWLTWQCRISWCLQVKRYYERHKNTCKIDTSWKNCKKIRNWIIGLKFFPLESENTLLHVKKITALPTASFLFYRLKMESFLYSLGSRQMRKKIAKWAGKSLSAENVQEWCPEQHIKTPLASPGSFLMGVLTP